VNAHVRLLGSPNERYALLFRDYLRAHDDVRDRWAETKRSIAATARDIDSYLDVKDPLTDVLMCDAEKWAEETGWRVSH
jgi:dephospho-CoA kinase